MPAGARRAHAAHDWPAVRACRAAQKRLAAGGAMVDVAAEIQVAEKRAAALRECAGGLLGGEPAAADEAAAPYDRRT